MELCKVVANYRTEVGTLGDYEGFACETYASWKIVFMTSIRGLLVWTGPVYESRRVHAEPLAKLARLLLRNRPFPGKDAEIVGRFAKISNKSR
jgi:hypothetical protein